MLNCNWTAQVRFRSGWMRSTVGGSETQLAVCLFKTNTSEQAVRLPLRLSCLMASLRCLHGVIAPLRFPSLGCLTIAIEGTRSILLNRLSHRPNASTCTTTADIFLFPSLYLGCVETVMGSTGFSQMSPAHCSSFQAGWRRSRGGTAEGRRRRRTFVSSLWLSVKEPYWVMFVFLFLMITFVSHCHF